MVHLWLELGAVAASLVVTLGIGLHFSRGGKKTIQEYMLGSRKMTTIPVSLSIALTYLSGSSMVSTCQEVYLYGLQMWQNCFFYVIFGFISAHVILPVSYNVKSVSTFEFFDKRYNSHVRKYASLMYAVETILHSAMSQYVPAVAVSQVTGLSTFGIACFLSLICWVYTATGGLKAVTYVDSAQAIFFLSCVIILFFVGALKAGGFWTIWQKGVDGHRMEFFNWDPSYDQRYSTMIGVVGSMVILARAFTSPSYHQRVVSMPTFELAKKVTIWSSIFIGIFLCFTYSMGMVVYAYFAGCDPVLGGKVIKNYSTILPYFVEVISEDVPGITGLFLTGVIAAGLSTTTSCWNTVACTFYEDLVKPFLGEDVSKQTALRLLTVIVFFVGVISTAFVYVIQNISSLMEATITLKSFTTSSSYILHVCGMIFPWINAKGAVTGSIFSALTTCYIAIGAQNAKEKMLVVNVPKMLTNSECIINGTLRLAGNYTLKTMGFAGSGYITESDPSVPWYLRMASGLYAIPGVLVGIMVAFLISWLTTFQDLSTVDPNMIIPQMRWTLPSLSLDDPVMIPLKDETMKKNVGNTIILRTAQ